MDFGSSHVYSGTSYYSAVPVTVIEAAPRNDTIYEAVETESQRNPTEPTYDPVAPDTIQPDRCEYDLVPYEPHLDPANSAQIEPKKNHVSSMFHVPKAFKVIKKKMKTKSSGSVSDLDSPPPLPPPRPIQSKPLPRLPGEPTQTGPPLPPMPKSFRRRNESDMSAAMAKTSISGITTTKEKSVLEKAGFDRPIYPALPNVYSDFRDNYELPPMVPTAPPSDTVNPGVVNVELIDFDSPVVSLAKVPPDKPPISNKNCENATIPVSVMTPFPSSAPLSTSMASKNASMKNKNANPYGTADTNVVSVKMSILEKMDNSMIWAMPPQRCTFCQAVVLHCSFEDEQEQICRFCGAAVEAQREALPLVGNESDVTFILNQPTGSPNDDPIIVFCIDTSGSMCVTSELQDMNGHFMSRLQSVKEGIATQLHQLYRSYPKCRVALVTFNNTVVSLGDGSPEQLIYLNDAQLYDTDYIQFLASRLPLPGYLGHTLEQLLKTLNLLKEHGGTALGPALHLSVALASKKPGSRVTVCTDGRANVGIGSLERESDYKMCHNFYTETSELAIKYGTMVSIVSIEGTDCRLVELGKVADKTAGKVKIGSVGTIAKEFQDILTNSLMATQVEVKIASQKELYFNDSATDCTSLVSRHVGNITRDSEITFKYGVKDEYQTSPPNNALFQLQVKFMVRNGCTCLRVITQVRPVTESRMLAEQGLNPAVMGTYASQLASKLVLDGELRDATLTTNAHKNLINRALSIRSTATERSVGADDEKIYGTVCASMDEINQEIKKVVDSIDAPPSLPPRPADSPSTLSRSSSMSSISFPEVPNNPIATKEKLVDAVEHCADEVATKLFKHRNACQGMFAT